jgi:hypothetical protein
MALGTRLAIGSARLRAALDKAAQNLRRGSTLVYDSDDTGSLERALTKVCDAVVFVISDIEALGAKEQL